VYFITTMKIKTITYKRVRNLGNYQSETNDSIAILGEGEDPHLAGEELKHECLGATLPRTVIKDDPELPESF
jgi:hypothetical protein